MKNKPTMYWAAAGLKVGVSPSLKVRFVSIPRSAWVVNRPLTGIKPEVPLNEGASYGYCHEENLGACIAWNKSKLLGQEPPLSLKEV
jgi:hypothetical protein